jgi:O-antigen ligase
MYFYLALTALALIVVVRRNFEWAPFVSRNWPILLFYLYLLVSVLWADSVLVSFKRWFKEAGNILLLMVILTEKNPRQAFRAVFVRCSYLLIPLSIVFLRYFPLLGRRYNAHSGELQVIGVTDQKNSLGAMALICVLVIIWDLFGNKWTIRRKGDWIGSLLKFGILILGVYLLRLSNSATSMLCLVLGGGILAATKVSFLRNTISRVGIWGLGVTVLLILSDAFFGLREFVVTSLGRNMTLTGRTEIWRELLLLDINPLIGTGFYSFWSDPYYLSQLPQWMPFSAHNGYLEIYMDGGCIGVFFLIVFLFITAARIQRGIASATTYSFLRYAALVIAVIANFSESNFARMTPIGFLFIFAAIEGLEQQDGYLSASTYGWSSLRREPKEMPASFPDGFL